MSISNKIDEIAFDKSMIKSAILAKRPSIPPTDAISQWPISIISIHDSKSSPKQWYGSGTHVWLHYDSNSYTHTFGWQIKMSVSTSASIDWGDGTTETISASPSVLTVGRTHTYGDGDFVLHITGYDECQLTYIGQSSGGNQRRWILFDAIEQFESDTKILQGNGNDGYTPIPMARNLRHINLTECTSISNVGIGGMEHVMTMLTAKVDTLNNPWVASQASFDELSFPSLTSMTGQVFNGIAGLRALSFGNGISSFPDNSVRNLGHIKSLTLPSSMTSLGSNFLHSSCLFMDSIKVPEGVTEFTGECFRTSGFRRIDLPSTVTSMGSSTWSFYGLNNLEELIIRAVNPPYLAGTNNLAVLPAYCRIYVPQGSGELYRTAQNWSAQSSKIMELDQNGNIPTD